MNRLFKPCAAAVVILLFTACASHVRQPTTKAADVPQKPNIVFILADDLGYGDLGAYGQTQIQTPNIDKLAAEGMRFTDAYAAPVCAPSRCSLLTGFDTGHTFIRGNKKIDLRPQDRTLTEILHDDGYYVFSIGKWSMGAVNSTGDPTHKGVDYFFGYIDQTHAHNSYPSYLYRNETKVPLRNVVPHEGRYGQGVATVKLDFSNDLFDQELNNYLGNRAAASQPFFIYAAFTAPHANDEAHENEVPSLGIYADKPWPLPEKQYAALVTRLDTSVGYIMKQLHDQHLDQNTLVIFASDNGIQKEGGTDPAFFHSAGPFRDSKASVYEGGIHVPFIARWTGQIAPATTSRLPIAFYDVLPTFTDLVHLPPPAATDGISFLPTLLHHAQKQTHEFMYWEFFNKNFDQAVRYNDGTTAWKAVRHSLAGPLELYNLATDLSESHNVAASHPEIVAKITTYLATARTDSKEYPITPSLRPKSRQ